MAKNAKGNAQRGHFKRRIFERYGIQVNDGEYDYLVSRIRKNDKSVVSFLMKQSNRISVHLVKYKESEIVIVYDKIRQTLCTCLPSDCKTPVNILAYISEVEE